jgi:hypothetical protein
MPHLGCRALVLCAAASLTVAGAGSTPEIARAQEEMARIERLVEAGAMPRAALDKARYELEDARDTAVLARTLYGNVAVEDLSEQIAREMTESATRRVERQQGKIEAHRKLVDAGALPRTALTPLVEELDTRRKAMDLAVSRSRLWTALAEMAKAEQALHDAEDAKGPAAETFVGSATYPVGRVLQNIETAFQNRFRRPLPVSASGETRLHRSMGFDHRNRIDVALHPDETEGRWLRNLLEDAGIPYLAFRSRIPGQATAAHIHIGPPSTRLRSSD